MTQARHEVIQDGTVVAGGIQWYTGVGHGVWWHVQEYKDYRWYVREYGVAQWCLGMLPPGRLMDEDIRHTYGNSSPGSTETQMNDT